MGSRCFCRKPPLKPSWIHLISGVLQRGFWIIESQASRTLPQTLPQPPPQPLRNPLPNASPSPTLSKTPPAPKPNDKNHLNNPINRRESSGGMERLGVWNCIFFGLWILKFRSLKFGENRSFCGISGIFLENSASEKYFSDSGKWPFHTPPIHTPTKCRPNERTLEQKEKRKKKDKEMGKV